MLQLYDATISNSHIRLRSVVYDQNILECVPPMLYVEDASTNGTIISRFSNIQLEVETLDTGTKYWINRQTGPQLLDHGDQLRLSARVTLQFCARKHCRVLTSMTDHQLEETSAFRDLYHVSQRKIGTGSEGIVLAALDLAKQRQMACKIVELKACATQIMHEIHIEFMQRHNFQQSSQSQKLQGYGTVFRQKLQKKLARIEQEHVALMGLSHPNIVNIERLYIATHNIYIMQELIPGGDLFSYVCMQKSGHLTEVEAAVIVRQLLDAVHYLHQNGFVHRDIKAENVLMKGLNAGSRVVLTDFGHARQLPGSKTPTGSCSRKRLFTEVGTIEYAAPEIYGRNTQVKQTGYTSAVDLWAVGIVAALLLTGEVIFDDHERPDNPQWKHKIILASSTRCDISVIDNEDHAGWAPVSSRAKSFVKQLLVLQESDRLTAETALEHSWFTHPAYAAELEGVYQRAISDFRPPMTNRSVERLDTSTLGPSPLDSVTASFKLLIDHERRKRTPSKRAGIRAASY